MFLAMYLADSRSASPLAGSISFQSRPGRDISRMQGRRWGCAPRSGFVVGQGIALQSAGNHLVTIVQAHKQQHVPVWRAIVGAAPRTESHKPGCRGA